MIHVLSLLEARSIAKELGGTYRKTGDWRYDNSRNEYLHEDSWTYFDWNEFYVWKKQK